MVLDQITDHLNLDSIKRLNAKAKSPTFLPSRWEPR
jgi:hypothetical protein